MTTLGSKVLTYANKCEFGHKPIECRDIRQNQLTMKLGHSGL